VGVSNLIVHASDFLELQFSSPVLNNAALNDVGNYFVSASFDANAVTVHSVATGVADSLTSVFLTVKGMEDGGNYSLSAENLVGTDEISIIPNVVNFIGRITKGDSAITRCPEVYDKRTSSKIRNVYQAIALEDDKIGGKGDRTLSFSNTTWSQDQDVWEFRLGIPLHWGVIFEGGALPFKDFVGSADVDTELLAGLVYTTVWAGKGADLAVTADATTGAAIGTTATDVLGAGTGNWSFFVSYRRGLTDETDTNRTILSINAPDEGIRILDRNNTSPKNWILCSCENQDNIVRNCVIQDGPASNSVVDLLFSRTSPTVLEAWVAEQGSPEIFHENIAIASNDNFNEAGGVIRVGGSALGNMQEGMQLKAAMFSKSAGSLDIFKKYRGAAHTKVTEA